MATAPDGGATLQPAGDGSPLAGSPGGMDMTMRVVAAAEAAAEAARAATLLLNRSTGDEGKTWWRLLPKPPILDHASRELELQPGKNGVVTFKLLTFAWLL